MKRLLSHLSDVSGSGTTLVSLYVPAGKRLQEPIDRLRSELTLASNVKSRTTRQAVEGALTRALSILRTLEHTPAHGLALFACSDEAEMVEPPAPIAVFLYRCESRFVLEPLALMCESTQRYGLIVVDRQEATFGRLVGKHVELLGNDESHVMGKHHMGGQSQARYARLIEQQAHAFYVEVGERANALFLSETDKLAGILIAGPGPTKDAWLDGAFMDYRLMAKVIRPTFSTGYTDEQGLRELVAAAGDAIAGLEVAAERRVLERFFTGVRTGLSVYGAIAVREALDASCCSTLITSETNYEEWDKVAGNAEVVVVSDESELGAQFVKGFGGVGALLRY